uniref:Uncharacterized protein n=1 Tax=Arion vulgaris TaxID=1028688 RepID=A0A0B6ZRJ1_9EUPU
MYRNLKTRETDLSGLRSETSVNILHIRLLYKKAGEKIWPTEMAPVLLPNLICSNDDLDQNHTDH